MKTFSIDLIALPLLFLPVILILMTVLALQLYNKTRKNKDLTVGILLGVSSFISFIPYRWATGELLLFWSQPFHFATIAVMLTLIGTWVLSRTLTRMQEWILIATLVVLILSSFLSPTVAGTLVSFVFIGIGIFLLNEVRGGQFNDSILAYSFLGLGLFIFIGHWFPFNGGRFLYGVLLLVLAGYEMHRLFGRVLNMLQAASIHSMIDQVTGLFNKSFMEKKVEQLTNEPFSIVFADIDDLGELTEEKGKLEANRLLQQVAGLFQEAVRDNGYVCRYNDAQLVGIVTKGDVEELAGRFCRQVAKKTGVTVSVGVTTVKSEEERNHPLRLAIERMGKAKRLGKNQVVVN